MQILPALTITTAISGVVVGPSQQLFADGGDIPRSLQLQATFTYGSGGTTAKFWVQTSFDGGLTWIDIASFAFTTASARTVYNLSSLTAIVAAYTATDGTLADNTAKDGILGPLYRVKGTTTGTYAGNTTLRIDLNAMPQ